MADTVLIVDDDESIRKLLQKIMGINGLAAECAASGAEALQRLKEKRFDIILMDVMLGDMEGFDVIKQLRADGIHTPVMIISGRNEDYDSLYGLSIGADDYVTKPFRPVVLGAKVKALIRRSHDTVGAEPDADVPVETASRAGENASAGNAFPALIQGGAFAYDPATMRFTKNGEELVLSSKEAALMLLFLKNQNRVIPKDEIHGQVWGENFVMDDNGIMVYINRLRGKIEEDPKNPAHIVTVKGAGYRFVV